ncbi:MAG: hypothetical protein ACTSR8_02795 [Promethearchaeota archaeon]
MCEFRIVRKNDGVQLGEEVVVAAYSENYELIFNDILGPNLSLESALIIDVNTLNQTLKVVEHPIIKDFLRLISNLVGHSATKDQVAHIQKQLDSLKAEL